jgi:uncharacterized protein YrrD
VNVLLRATEIEGRPVVTLDGERVGDVKDVVFDSSHGKLLGLTLRSHRFFSGPRTDVLAWSDVGSLGRDAVMIRGEDALKEEEALAAEGVPDDRDVLGNQVLTDAGTDLGKVVDVIIETGTTAQIVGYEVAASEALATNGEHVLIPLPDTISVSGEHLMVPTAALAFVSHDLSGFGAAVESFRAKLRGGPS